MSKNIVLCLDGTWNGPDVKAIDGTYTPTNVQKVFQALRGSGVLTAAQNEAEISAPVGANAPAQVAKYIHGVGDAAGNPIAKACEGAVGLGLVGRIIRGYTYLSRMYEPGDNIFIIGFSRGAYTARALAGLVVSQGLLEWKAMNLAPQSEASYGAGLAAWHKYKASQHADDRELLQAIAGMITCVSDKIMLGLHPSPPLQFVTDVPIKAVAVWDTVGALGVPDNITEKDGTVVRKDVFQFVDTELSGQVVNGFHAIAVDEQRVDFTPSIWQDRVGVVQVLFPGAHADIGGGYLPAQSGLANCALIWMAQQLSAVGVQFSGPLADQPNAIDIQHRPWVGGGVRYATSPRQFPLRLRLSQRVLERMAAPTVPVESQPAAAPYRPMSLAKSYVTPDWKDSAPHVQMEP